MVTVRRIESIEEFERVEQVLAAQFPKRSAARSRHLDDRKRLFERDRSLMLVAESAGRIVGGATAFRSDGAVKVDVIALTADARRIGIGRLLMETIENEASALGATELYLGGANAENRGFYWRLGFMGRRSLMRKALPRLREHRTRS